MPLWVSKLLEVQREKKARYTITNVSMKEISNIIKYFEKLPYKGYVWKRPKHEPTDSYFYLTIHISKCMMRADAFNSHADTVRKEITGMQDIPISIFFLWKTVN